MNLFFDTQQIYRDLAKKGGFNEIQAEALTDVLKVLVGAQSEKLATKEDVGRLIADIGRVETGIADIKSDLAENTAMLSKFARRDELQALREEAATKNDLQLMQQQLTIRLGGLIALGVGLLAAMQQVLG